MSFEILDKIMQNLTGFSKIRIREHRDNFVGIAVGGKTTYRAKVFVKIQALTHRNDPCAALRALIL